MSFKFNPFTGNFDRVIDKNKVKEIIFETVPAEEIREIAREVIQSIKTTEFGALGNRLYAYDPIEDKWVDLGQRVIYDEDGNVVIGEPEES